MSLKGEAHVLGRPTYKSIQTITEGNTAICKKSYHDVYEQWCVQKTVSLLGVSDSFASHEPKLLRSLKHPYLIEIWEAQWDPQWGDKAVTFTMPFYEGGSLYNVLDGGHTFSLGESLSLVCNILDALHFLHVEKKLVHRDIKPGNIFLSDDLAAAYIGDFGSAASIADGPAEWRGGTPLYKAPEWRTGSYQPQADLYSVGLILRELLGGRFRYEDIDMDALDKRLLAGQRALRQRDLDLPSHVPEKIRRLTNRLLQKDPALRPQAALSVQRELQDVRHVNWRPVEIEYPRTWIGEARANYPRGVPRDIEVTAARITRGLNSGKVQLTARWRFRNAEKWRNMSKFDVAVAEDDQNEWRAFFKSVSTEMLQSTERR